MTTHDLHELYSAALAADDEFSAALRREYGAAAGECRYWTREHRGEVKATGEKMRAATETWLKAYRASAST